MSMKCTKVIQILSGVLLALASSGQGLASSEIHAIVGSPTQGGEVRTFAEGTGLPLAPPAELRGIRLLPLDFNGRLTSDHLLPQAPKQRADIEGAGRIELPEGKGVLYRYRRSIPGQAELFGFMHIDPAGNVRVLGERIGSGQLATEDPYLGRVALGPDGERFLAMTTRAAGGDLFEVVIQSGESINRSAGLPALDFRPQSARLLGDWCLVVARQGTFRWTAGAGDQLSAVFLEGNPTFHSGELVLSQDHSQGLLTAGANSSSLHAWVVAKTGDGRRASSVPGPMSNAGYLPEATHGPFLAVANDGVLCAWRMEGAGSREVFARRSTAPANQSAALITGNNNFTDTLDEAGVLNMAQIGSLVMAVGEVGTDPGVGIEKADFFEVTLNDQGVSTIRNITGTSGQSAPPFLSIPSMTPLLMRWLPGTQSYVMYDEQSGGTGRLVELDLVGSGVRLLKDDIKEVFFIEQAGNALLVSVRLSTGSKPHQLLRFPSDLSSPPSVVLDTGDSALLHPVVDATGWIAFKEVPDVGQQRLWSLGTNPQALSSFPLLVDSFGPVLAWSPNGDLAFSFDLNGLRSFAAWPRASAPYRLRAVNTAGAVLPGR